jgi:hypothetical protein
MVSGVGFQVSDGRRQLMEFEAPKKPRAAVPATEIVWSGDWYSKIQGKKRHKR